MGSLPGTNMRIQLHYSIDLPRRFHRCIHSALCIESAKKNRWNRRHSHIEVSQMWLRTTSNEERRQREWRQWDPEKAARDGFIKNFDHRQMGSRMEALVYSGTHDEEEREIGRRKKRKNRTHAEKERQEAGRETRRPLKLLAIYLRRPPLHGFSSARLVYRVYQKVQDTFLREFHPSSLQQGKWNEIRSRYSSELRRLLTYFNCLDKFQFHVKYPHNWRKSRD